MDVVEKREIEIQLGIEARSSKLQLDVLTTELLELLVLEQSESWRTWVQLPAGAQLLSKLCN